MLTSVMGLERSVLLERPGVAPVRPIQANAAVRQDAILQQNLADNEAETFAATDAVELSAKWVDRVLSERATSHAEVTELAGTLVDDLVDDPWEDRERGS